MITNKNMSNEDLLLKLIERALILKSKKTINKREVERYRNLIDEVILRMNKYTVFVYRNKKNCPYGRNV